MKTGKVIFLIFLSLLSLCFASVQPVKSQSFEPVYIKADGSVVGADKIQRNGNLYTLTGDISGSIHVQRSYILIDGAGHAIRGNGTDGGIVVSWYYSYGYNSTIYGATAFVNNVTVVNFQIFSFYAGIAADSTHNNTFIGNYIEDCEEGFGMTCRNNIITHNTVKDCSMGISINYGGNNIITENNFMNNNVIVFLSPGTFVDENYWLDSSYIYQGPDSATYKDNHPLGSPVDISDFEFPKIPTTPIDTKPPNVTVFSPKNITYTINNVSIALNVTEPPSWIGYSLDGKTNVTITGPTNLTELSDGEHNLTVYANDAAGNMGNSETIYFTIETQRSELTPPVDPMGITLALAIVAAGLVAFMVYFIRVKKTPRKSRKDNI